MEIIYIAILFFSFLAGETKSLKFSILSLVPHSIFIVIVVFIIGYVNNIPSLYLIAVLDLVVRAILMPILLFKCLKNRVETETKPSISHPLSIALSIVLLSIGYHFVEMFKSSYIPHVISSFSSGLTLFLYGFYLFISKRDILKMMISFFIIENGIHFLIISMIPRMPKFIEVLITFNFVVAIIFLVYISLRLNEIFVREEIEKLKKSSSQRS
ncbi:MAG: hypothetical protein NZ845_01705 [Thermodesulfovibrio sp.]|nr:hypothetical protein [Thermodesulfovibrio sp.]MCX7724547.1 hypothetical protein [Thermodesulfovibrio sp.]MDW7972475.1 hypothetical protein [Thermodesulfovibrio sp.]